MMRQQVRWVKADQKAREDNRWGIQEQWDEVRDRVQYQGDSKEEKMLKIRSGIRVQEDHWISEVISRLHKCFTWSSEAERK